MAGSEDTYDTRTREQGQLDLVERAEHREAARLLDVAVYLERRRGIDLGLPHTPRRAANLGAAAATPTRCSATWDPVTGALDIPRERCVFNAGHAGHCRDQNGMAFGPLHAPRVGDEADTEVTDATPQIDDDTA